MAETASPAELQEEQNRDFSFPLFSSALVLGKQMPETPLDKEINAVHDPEKHMTYETPNAHCHRWI